MKELYIAPEAKLLCFVAQQQLATNSDKSVTFDDLLGGLEEGKRDPVVDPRESDIGVTI